MDRYVRKTKYNTVVNLSTLYFNLTIQSVKMTRFDRSTLESRDLSEAILRRAHHSGDRGSGLEIICGLHGKLAQMRSRVAHSLH